MDTSSIYEFNINDILYCYYGNLLYEAKCLKRRIASDGEIEYFIHYCGFKKRYDEWVEKDRVLEINDTNIVHKSTLEYYQSKRKRTYNKTKDKVDKKTSDSSQPPKKRGRPYKNAKIEQCIAPSETPESDIGKIDSNVQSTETYCTPVPLKSIETPGFDIEESNVSIIKSTGTRSSSRPNKDVNIAKCLSHCETSKLGIGQINSEVQSTETYCTPVSPKSIKTPRPYVKKSSVSKFKSSATRESNRSYKTPKFGKYISPYETPESDIGKIDSNVQPTETNCTPIPLKSIETPGFDMEESNVSIIKSTGTRSSSRPNKDVKIAKCIAPCETPESDIGIIDSNVQSTETYCTPIPLKSIETPGLDMEESNVSRIKSTGTCSSSRPYENVNIAKCVAPCETPESDIGKIDSNVQSTETYCTPIPSISIETPVSDINESSVSEIKSVEPCSSSTALSKELADHLEISLTLKPNNTKLFGVDTVSFSQSEFTEFIKEDKKYTETINIAKNFTLSFSTDVPQATLPPIKIPPLITDIINDDWVNHNQFQKVLDFPNVHTVADLIYDFIKIQKSLHTISGEKAHIYGITLLNLFNYVVNKQLLYQSERKCFFQNKSFHNWFMKGRADKSRIYVLKEFLVRKKVWCYAYGPVHLMRLFVNLSKRTLTDDKELAISAGSPGFLQFVENNVSKYFSERHYISTDDLLSNTNVNLNSSTTDVIQSSTT